MVLVVDVVVVVMVVGSSVRGTSANCKGDKSAVLMLVLSYFTCVKRAELEAEKLSLRQKS